MIAAWNLRACAPRCHRCGRAFADREKLVSRLLFSPAAGYAREDFCAGCWPYRAETPLSVPAAPDQSLLPAPAIQISDWAAVFRAPPAKPEEPLKRETAETLLRRLMEDPDPAQRDVVFILAVMLERRRIFVEREVRLQPDGRKIRLYEHRKTGESFVIPDPGLRLADLAPLQEQVAALLAPDAPPPAASPATSPAVSPAVPQPPPAET